MEKERKKSKMEIGNGPALEESIWVEPVGGFGDMLMVSGVLKLAKDKYPDQKYKLVRRSRYLYIFKDHPAVEQIGYPPKEAKVIRTDYWTKEKLGEGNQRPFQILARAFGLSTPVEEKLYLAGKIEVDNLLDKIIPWKEKNIIIAPGSDSPRKMMAPPKWERIVEGFASEKFLIIQVGRIGDRHIKGTYSLLGLTTPQQLVAILKKVDMVITVDNFIMHAAHMVKTPTISIFGPTQPEIYGYGSQVLLQAPIGYCQQRENCLTPAHPQNYPSFCPLLVENHCMNTIKEEVLLTNIFKKIDRR